MIASDIPFSDFAPSEAKLINQALRSTLDRVSERTTIFYPYGSREYSNDKPWQSEVDHAREILGYALDYQAIFYGAEQFVTDALRFIAWDIETWVSGRPQGQPLGTAYMEYSQTFGVDADQNTTTKLLHIARRICPQSEIYLSCMATTLPSDGYLDGCRKALEQVLAPAPLGSVEYNAHVGIVVDGILYNLPRIHPVVTALLNDIVSYQQNACLEDDILVH